ncbi:MAG: hypothetical protein ACI8PZ_001411 [Myxococcota bacterium]|jgi:hypothetical protein
MPTRSAWCTATSSPRTSLLWNGLLHGRFEDEALAISLFEAHNAAVRAAVPPVRLLEYQVGAGWEPLCTFFDLPVPEVPYPNRNNRREYPARSPIATHPEERGVSSRKDDERLKP